MTDSDCTWKKKFNTYHEKSRTEIAFARPPLNLMKNQLECESDDEVALIAIGPQQ
jgi:hypothetical protein